MTRLKAVGLTIGALLQAQPQGLGMGQLQTQGQSWIATVTEGVVVMGLRSFNRGGRERGHRGPGRRSSAGGAHERASSTALVLR